MLKKKLKIIWFELGIILGRSDFEYPIFVIYLLSRGLSNSEIALLFSIQAIAVFVFEYVTGVISDKLGSKSILIIGSVSMIIAESIFIMSESLVGNIFAICFISFGVAAKSGADIASLHDLIIYENVNSTFEKEIGGFMAMKTIWPIFALIIGSNCFLYHNKLPFILTIASNIVAIISFIVTLPKNVPCKKKSTAIIKSALKKSFSSKNMILLLSVVMFVNPIYQLISNNIQTNVENTKMTIGSLGYIYIFMNAGEAIGSKLFYSFSKKVRTSYILRYAVLGMGIFTCIMATKMYILIIILLGMVYGIISAANIIEINAVADNYNRATMMSQQHAMIKISQTVFFAICTALLRRIELSMVLYLSGFILVVLYFSYRIFLGKVKVLD